MHLGPLRMQPRAAISFFLLFSPEKVLGMPKCKMGFYAGAVALRGPTPPL